MKTFLFTSFRTQLISGIGLFLTLLISLFTYIETTNNINLMRKKGLEQVSDHSTVLASMVKIWILSDDYAGLEEALDNFSIYSDLTFAAVLDMEGKVIAHTDRSIIGRYVADERRIVFLQKAQDNKNHNIAIFRDKKHIDVFRVIHNGDKHIGIVHLRFDRSARLALIHKQIYEAVAFGIFYLMFTVLILFYIVNRFTSQLESLLQTMKKIHDGNREVKANEEGYNELSELSRQFNEMLDTITSGEKELKEVKERLESAVNGTQDGLWDWNLITNEVYFSPRWKEMLGYSDDELPNVLKTWEDNIHPDDRQKAEEAVAYSHEKPGQFYENIHRVRHKDGHWLWILARGQTLFDEEGKSVRMVGFHTDITKQKELEQELFEQEELMIAQSRHVAMGEMIGMIAHQWRQPVTIIAMGANGLLLDAELDEVNAEHIVKEAKEILQQTQYLSKTIDDFRNFFRPDKEKDEVKIATIFMELQQIIGKSLEHHNIVLSITGYESTTIRTYSRELLQVFLNIIKNSQEAIEQSGSQEGRIDVNIEDQEDSLCIRISDNGGGADASVLNRMFEPYFSTKDKKTGTGLGLYMSKTIINKHLFGQIKAENKADGIEFTIVIPKQMDDTNV